MIQENLISVVALAVALLGTPCAVVVSLMVFRAVTQFRVGSLEDRVTVVEQNKEAWRVALQDVRDEINGLRVDIAKHMPKESGT